jgi:hypothetical protein
MDAATLLSECTADARGWKLEGGVGVRGSSLWWVPAFRRVVASFLEPLDPLFSLFSLRCPHGRRHVIYYNFQRRMSRLEQR